MAPSADHVLSLGLPLLPEKQLGSPPSPIPASRLWDSLGTCWLVGPRPDTQQVAAWGTKELVLSCWAGREGGRSYGWGWEG